MRDANLTPTGRELKEPAGSLVECLDPEGLKHTVIAFDEPYRGHSALTTSVDLIMSFMAYPMVTGLVECSFADTRLARFAYPTGTIWTLKEILRGHEQVGQTAGLRAGIELCYLGGMILSEAGENGAVQGCFSHGNLSPWRIGLKADGQLQIFGYGLAQVEVAMLLSKKLEHLGLDSIRYAPPERLEGQPEQPSSDTYALAVAAFELMTGEVLFNETDPEALWEAAKLAEGVQRAGTHKKLPGAVQQVLASALAYDPDRRLQGSAFVDAMGNLLDDPLIAGKTLVDVMDRFGNQKVHSKRKLVKTTETAAFSLEDLAAAAAEDDEDDEDVGGAKPVETRWSTVRSEATTGRSARRARGTDDRQRRRSPDATRRPDPGAKTVLKSPPATTPAAGPPPPPSSLASSSIKPADAPATAAKADKPGTAPPSTAAETELDDGPRRRRRRRGSAPTSSEPEGLLVPEHDDEDDDESEESPDSSADGDSPRRRRRRRPPEVPDTTETVVESPRRRRRRAPEDGAETTDDDDADEAASEKADEDGPVDGPRRRRRRAEAPEADAESEDNREDDEDASNPDEPRRRRRRRSTDDE